MGLSSTFLVDFLESENSAVYTIKVIKDGQSSLMLTLDMLESYRKLSSLKYTTQVNYLN